MAWLIASLHRLRDERSATVTLILLVFVTAFVFAVTPRAFEGIADRAVQTQVRDATSFDRDIQLLETGRIDGTEADPLGLVDSVGAQRQDQMPSSVAALIDDRSVVVDSLRWSVAKETADPTFLRFRLQPDAGAHLVYAAGRAPTGSVRHIADPLDPGPTSATVPVFEIALSRSSAKVIGASLGDIVPLTPDRSDELVGRGDPAALTVGGEVVGLYDVTDMNDPFWMGDAALAAPAYRGTLITVLVDVTAVLAPDAYPALLAETASTGYPVRYAWRYRVDPERIHADTSALLLADLRRLDSTFQRIDDGSGGTTLRSGLLHLMETWTVRWASATTLLGVIAVGPVVVALAAMAMVVLLVVARRRAGLALSRGRGASTSQVIGSSVAEGLLVAIPASAIAVLAAVLVVPAGSIRTSVVAGLAIALGTTLLLVVALIPTAVADPRGPGRERAGGSRRSTRRLILEGFVVVSAIAGAYLLRERGIASVGAVGGAGGAPTADPLIAAVPALAGLAAGLVLVRLLPLPIRALGSLARRRRGLVPMLAMRRAAAGGSAGSVLLVLMAATAIAAFSVTTLLHLDAAGTDIAWQQVGASYLLTGGVAGLPSDLDPAALPEVEASAATFQVRTALPTRALPLTFVAVDAGDFETVVSGTPGDPRLPADLLAPTAGAGAPYPAIVSSEFGTGTQALAVGDTFSLPIEGRSVTFSIAEIRARFPAVAQGVPFVVASRDQLRVDLPDGLRANASFYVRADESPATAAAIRAGIHERAPFAVLRSRAELAADLRTSPVIDAIALGVALAGLVAAGYSAISIAAALALAGTAQAVEVAHLRTMGLTRREGFGLVVAEHGPTIAIGFLAGLAFGYLLFAAVRPGLGLDTLVGSTLDIPVRLGLDQVVAIAAAMIAIAAIGIGLGAFLQRRAIPASAVRRGFE